MTPAQQTAIDTGWTDDQRVGEALVRRGLMVKQIYLRRESKRSRGRVRSHIKSRQVQHFRYWTPELAEEKGIYVS